MSLCGSCKIIRFKLLFILFLVLYKSDQNPDHYRSIEIANLTVCIELWRFKI